MGPRVGADRHPGVVHRPDLAGQQEAVGEPLAARPARPRRQRVERGLAGPGVRGREPGGHRPAPGAPLGGPGGDLARGVRGQLDRPGRERRRQPPQLRDPQPAPRFERAGGHEERRRHPLLAQDRQRDVVVVAVAVVEGQERGQRGRGAAAEQGRQLVRAADHEARDEEPHLLAEALGGHREPGVEVTGDLARRADGVVAQHHHPRRGGESPAIDRPASERGIDPAQAQGGTSVAGFSIYSPIARGPLPAGRPRPVGPPRPPEATR